MRKMKRTLVTNACLILIIGFVYVASFGFLTPVQGLALKGCTGQNAVGLQIMVDEQSDVDAYLERLKRMAVTATFFFCEQCENSDSDTLTRVVAEGHGVGYYVCEKHGEAADMYIGHGYSVPVMSYEQNGAQRRVGPSIDFTLLRMQRDWHRLLSESIFGDMFIRIDADNQFDDFEKVVQIVRDKGYTILKVEEML